MKRWLALWVLTAVVPAAAADVSWAVGKLRVYCAACHALGDLRFIRSDDDHEVWDFIFHNRAPKSKKIWADGISEVLRWPTDTAPAFNQMMKPPDQDWMPKGKKRLALADDTQGSIVVRRQILEELKSGAFDGESLEGF